MPRPPDLFDPVALTLRRERAARAPAEFLHREAAEIASERLIEINRSFTAPAIVGPMPGVWQEALAVAGLPPARMVPDAEVLALEPQAHDLIVHALALHWANDPVGQLVQMRRALRPDGLMLACLFGGRSLSQLRSALAEAEVGETGGLSPRVAPMGDLRDLGALLQRAGLALPVADATLLTISYPDLFALMRDLRAMGETNVMTARRRTFLPRGVLDRAQEIYRAAYGDGDGRLPATAELVFLTGWAPSETQPQPLRPGSAAMRLADALGTEERPAGDRVRGND